MESQQIFPEKVDMNENNKNNTFHEVEIEDNVHHEAIPNVETSNNNEKNNTDFIKIKWLHFSAFLFFLIQTIIYSAINVDSKVNPTIGQVDSNCNGPACYTTLKYLGETNPIFLIPLFVALACFDHLICYLICQFYQDTAKFWLFTVGSNPLRWIEYSFSASFMAVAISILCGISDVHLWLLIFSMHFIGMYFGLIMEILPKTTINNRIIDDLFPIKVHTIKHICYWLGFICIFTPWLVMCCYFFRAIDNSVPKFVYAAFLGTLVLFLTFGVNSYLYSITQLYNFPTAEIIYISLSFTAKTFLAADVFGGLNATSNDDD